MDNIVKSYTENDAICWHWAGIVYKGNFSLVNPVLGSLCLWPTQWYLCEVVACSRGLKTVHQVLQYKRYESNGYCTRLSEKNAKLWKQLCRNQ
jgi:hypothetical protein